MHAERILITGGGSCTPAGCGLPAAREAVGQLSPVGRFTTALPMPADLALERSYPVAKAKAPAPETIPGLARPFPDLFVQLAIVAVDEALASAGLLNGGIDRSRIGLVLTSALCPLETVARHLATLFRDGPARISPMGFSRTVFNAVVGEISRRHSLQGPSTLVPGSSALGYAYDLLQQGDADAIVCVGVEELRDLHVYAYAQAGLLDGGLVLGEASAAIVLESASSARRRHVPVRAEVADYSAGFCPESVLELTAATPEALAETMGSALAAARLAPAEVGLVVALANGDPGLDQAERAALAAVLGRPVPALEPKLTFGETFAAAGLLGVLLAADALSDGPEGTRAAAVLVNACEVGGTVWSAALRRWES